MNKKVQNYIDALPSPQKEICKRVRKVIIKTFPDIEESFKNGVPWYEDKFYLVGLKDHVNIGFSIKGLKRNELDNLEGQGKLMRHIKIYSVNDIDEAHIVNLLKLVK